MTKGKVTKVSHGKVRGPSRDIPEEVKDLVLVRDGGQCTYQAEDDTRCTCTHDLEVHHIKPFALGGSAKIENLKLVCRAHNFFYAEMDFGREKMRRYRKG